MSDENYALGNEESFEWPVDVFPEEFRGPKIKNMDVKQNTKFEKINIYVKNYFEKYGGRFVIYRGHGEAAEKVISCVEIFKRKFEKPLYQWTKLALVSKINYLEPKKEGLERLKVTASVPGIFILVSQDPFPDEHKCSSMQCSTEKEADFPKSEAPNRKKFNKKPVAISKENKWARPKKCKPIKEEKQETKPEQLMIKEETMRKIDESIKNQSRSPKKRKSSEIS